MTEDLHCNNGICGEGGGIEFGVVDHHLLNVRSGTLGVRVGEVGVKIVERGPHPSHFLSESVENHLRCLLRATGIIVKKDKGEVIPVLRLPSRTCRRALGKQEPGHAGYVHLGNMLDPADSRSQLPHLDVL